MDSLSKQTHSWPGEFVGESNILHPNCRLPAAASKWVEGEQQTTRDAHVRTLSCNRATLSRPIRLSCRQQSAIIRPAECSSASPSPSESAASRQARILRVGRRSG